MNGITHMFQKCDLAIFEGARLGTGEASFRSPVHGPLTMQIGMTSEDSHCTTTSGQAFMAGTRNTKVQRRAVDKSPRWVATVLRVQLQKRQSQLIDSAGVAFHTSSITDHVGESVGSD